MTNPSPAPGAPIGPFSGEYRWLSNFAPCTLTPWWVRVDGAELSITPPTVEHAYQASKFRHRVEHLVAILRAPTAGRAKRLGQQYPPSPDWDTQISAQMPCSLKMQSMGMLLTAKFDWTLNPTLNALLLATGTRELIEENEWGDTYWGTVNGVGTNHLGKLLTTIRAYWSFYARTA